MKTNMTEREMLIRAYEGVQDIPVKDFAIMTGKSYDTVRRRFKQQIKHVDGIGYVLERNLLKSSSVSSHTR